MNRNLSPNRPFWILSIGAIALLMGLPAQAEIYKWIDANGKTHYSENKDEAGKNKAEQVKIQAQSNQAGTPTSRSWQDQEQESKQNQVRQQQAQASQPPTPSYNPPSSSRGPTEPTPETDASRCARAQRDSKIIHSGRGVHGNGAPIDANDREVVARDIKSFCH